LGTSSAVGGEMVMQGWLYYSYFGSLDGLRKKPLICVLGRAGMRLVMKRTRARLMPATVIVVDDDIMKEVGGIAYQFCDRY